MRGFKITGWSSLHGSCGVTGHMVAIGTMAAAYYGAQVTLSSNHLSDKMLENYLSVVSRKIRRFDTKKFFSSPDYPDWVGRRSFYEIDSDRDWFKGRSRIEVGRHLYWGKPVTSDSDDPFMFSFDDSVSVVDSSGENNPYSFRTLEEADLVVVFMPCDEEIISGFFHEYKSLKKKMVLVINRYSTFNSFNLKNIKAIAPSNVISIMTIPYSYEFEYACRHGCVDEHIMKYIGRRSTSSYFKHIKALTTCILQQAK